MALALKNALWRGWIFASLNWTKKPPASRNAHALPKSLSDHLARDIGVTQAELDRLRHVWPSETQNHPRL